MGTIQHSSLGAASNPLCIVAKDKGSPIHLHLTMKILQRNSLFIPLTGYSAAKIGKIYPKLFKLERTVQPYGEKYQLLKQVK